MSGLVKGLMPQEWVSQTMTSLIIGDDAGDSVKRISWFVELISQFVKTPGEMANLS